MRLPALKFQKLASMLIVLSAIVLWAFVIRQSTRDLYAYSRGDLQTRIAGARCLMDGINPYHSPTAVLPEYYRADGPTTPTPAHLLLYAPLRNLPIDVQRQIYYWIDWVIVFGCLLAMQRLMGEGTPFPALLFLFTCLLVLDATFRLHLARGQLYLSLLLLGTIAAAGLKRRVPGWLCPAALALLVLLRPTYLIAVAALLLLGYRLFVARVAVAFALVATASISITGIHVWTEYVQMMRRAPGELFVLRADTESGTAAAIRDVSKRKFLSLDGFERDRTFLGLFTSRALANAAHRYWVLNPSMLTRANLTLMMLSANVGLLFAFRLRSVPDVIPRMTFAFLLPIDIECFAPVRFAYADVLLVLPLMLVCSSAFAPSTRHGKWNLPTLTLLAGALVFAALSRIHVGLSMSVLSVGRFFATLAVLNLFCIWRTLPPSAGVAEFTPNLQRANHRGDILVET